MRDLPLIILILLCSIGCKQNSTSTPINPDYLLGKWILVSFECSIPSPLMTITFTDSVSYNFERNACIYTVRNDTLTINNSDWGEQSYKIIKLSPDSLILQQIRQQIYADSLDDTLISYPLEKFIRG